MNYIHNYEYAFYHYMPDYMGRNDKAKTNIARYTITGTYVNGEYFRLYADNRKDLEDWLNRLRDDVKVHNDSIAVQNGIGQLLWNSETGASDIAPKFMNGTTKDSDQCFYTGFWKDYSGWA